MTFFVSDAVRCIFYMLVEMCEAEGVDFNWTEIGMLMAVAC